MCRWSALALVAAIASARSAPARADRGEEGGGDAPPAAAAASPAPVSSPAPEPSPVPADAQVGARIEEPAAEPAPAAPVDRIRREPSTLRRIAAVGVAIVPGFLVRGAGSYVVGERRTGKRLLMAGAAGLTVASLGGAVLGGTSASEKVLWPGIPVTLIGAGVYLPTWFADIWVAAGGERVRGGPSGTAPWSVELATVLLRDPYRTRALAGAAASVELGRLGLGAAALLDARGDARTGELEARWRILGAAAANGPIDEGSRLHVRAAGRYHRDDPDDVTLATAELELVGRGELRHLDPRLAGMFLELSTGVGVERATYARGVDELGSLMLGRFGWGAYLGRRGEAVVFYDHRRDHLAGGLFAWRAAGFVGSLGAAAQVAVAGPWAVRGELEVGNAWVGTLGVRYRGGAR